MNRRNVRKSQQRKRGAEDVSWLTHSVPLHRDVTVGIGTAEILRERYILLINGSVMYCMIGIEYGSVTCGLSS